MSSDIAIQLSNLSKCYQIYDKPQHRLWQGLVRGRKQFYREFWALKDVSFEVKKGETVGIIGRNGSGKSTLLQLICGTLTPNSGNIEVNGRVAALLELGAGFNPEFTGRENVYMNASVLGLSKQEIDAKYDDIAAFADIGEFIEQPVKTYSSGMFARLALSVAINVEPDILVVDEALSVGDIAFRNNCMIKIKQLRDQGKTILFVSHDLSTLQLICDKVIWLNNGLIVANGQPISVCQQYYAFMAGDKAMGSCHRETFIPQQDTGFAKFIEFKIYNWDSEGVPVFSVGQDIPIKFSIIAQRPLGPIVFGMSIYRSDGDWIVGQTSSDAKVMWPGAKASEMREGLFILSPNCLVPGIYRAALAAYPEDHSICYALTEIAACFSVRSDFPTWGKFLHPCKWVVLNHGEYDQVGEQMMVKSTSAHRNTRLRSSEWE
jgi:ABC-type polysaccharide/polyol phosphate transport system ATPase subunit